MMKKIISLLLVVCMLAACCTVFAADSTTSQQKAEALYLLGLFKGTDKGYELDNHTTREQGVAMLVRLLGASEEANSGNYTCPFADVYDWAKGYVGYAYSKGITKGISETEFGYGVELTDAMFLTMLMRIIGYTEGETGDASADFVWNDPYTIAQSIGLLQDASADSDFSRGDMVEIIYNALGTKYKGTSNSVASQLIKDGVIAQNAYDQAKKVADGTTTLKDAEAALAGSGSTGDNTGGSTGGNITTPATPDPTPGIGGTGGVVEDSAQEDHETPDMGI